MLTSVDFYISSNNNDYILLGSVTCSIKPDDQTSQVHTFEKLLAEKTNVRYLKIVAKNFGKLPDWHLGKGGEAFIFVDELEIR